MEKIVLVHHAGSEPCFYTIVTPGMYSCVDDAEYEFHELCKKGKTFNFLGEEWYPNDFFEKEVYYGPKFFTLEKWFEYYSNN